MSKITRSEFQAQLAKGWRRQKFVTEMYHDGSGGACALGAACDGYNMGKVLADMVVPCDYGRMLPKKIVSEVVHANDTSKTKREANQKIKALKWPKAYAA
ncbi:MAG: hypothetical protein ABI067_12615 [Leifsonia sp.]